MADLRPEHMAVESLFTHPRHLATGVRMGHARGVILLCWRCEGSGGHGTPTRGSEEITDWQRSSRQAAHATGNHRPNANLPKSPNHPTWPMHWQLRSAQHGDLNSTCVEPSRPSSHSTTRRRRRAGVPDGGNAPSLTRHAAGSWLVSGECTCTDAITSSPKVASPTMFPVKSAT